MRITLLILLFTLSGCSGLSVKDNYTVKSLDAPSGTFDDVIKQEDERLRGILVKLDKCNASESLPSSLKKNDVKEIPENTSVVFPKGTKTLYSFDPKNGDPAGTIMVNKVTIPKGSSFLYDEGSMFTLVDDTEISFLSQTKITYDDDDKAYILADDSKVFFSKNTKAKLIVKSKSCDSQELIKTFVDRAITSSDNLCDIWFTSVNSSQDFTDFLSKYF